MRFEKQRFDDFTYDSGPEYHGFHLLFIEGNRAIHGIIYDELEDYQSVTLTNRGRCEHSPCAFEDWSEEDFGPFPVQDLLLDFALQTLKAEFGTRRVLIWATPESVEIEV